MMREKEEIQDKQMELLKQILEEVRREMPEAAVSNERGHIVSKKKKKEENKTKKRKLFAKSV